MEIHFDEAHSTETVSPFSSEGPPPAGVTHHHDDCNLKEDGAMIITPDHKNGGEDGSGCSWSVESNSPIGGPALSIKTSSGGSPHVQTLDDHSLKTPVSVRYIENLSFKDLEKVTSLSLSLALSLSAVLLHHTLFDCFFLSG